MIVEYNADGMAARMVWTPEIAAMQAVARATRWLCPVCRADTGWTNRGSGRGGICNGHGRWIGYAVPDREYVPVSALRETENDA